MFNRKKDEFLSDKTKKMMYDLVKPTPRPFYKRAKSITCFEDLMNRIAELNACIESCNSNVARYQKSIDDIKDKKVLRVEGYGREVYFNTEMYNVEHTPEDEEFLNYTFNFLEKKFNNKINYFKELGHTCQDELDWLYTRMNGVTKNFEKGGFDFDPEKHHA